MSRYPGFREFFVATVQPFLASVAHLPMTSSELMPISPTHAAVRSQINGRVGA